MLFDYFLTFRVSEFVFALLRILIELTILHIINVHYRLQQAIQTLKRNKNIIIKPADKGGATVILNRYDYIKEGKNQLNHQQNYQPLSSDPTKNFKLELTKFIKSFPDPYKSQLLSYIPHNPQPGKFYLLPKIHKPNNPGRSIISNNNTLTEHLSHFVETLLKPDAQVPIVLSKILPTF